MRGLRKVQPRKPPKERKGLDDRGHRERIKLMGCLLKGRRCRITRWVGVYPDKREVTEEYVHVCQGPIDPHHTTKKSQRGHDYTCVPLCRAAHGEAEKLTNEQFKERWGIALPVIASQLAPKKGSAA